MRKNSGIFAGLLAGTMMTPAERAAGRFMRAPDGHGPTGDTEFDDFNEGAEVQVGKPAEGAEEKPVTEEKPKPRSKPPKEAPVAKPETPAEGEGDDDEAKKKPAAEPESDENEGDEEEGDEEEQPKKRKLPSERIRDLSARLRQSERLRLADAERIDALEKKLLQPGGGSSNGAGTETPAPDPTDVDKYPLGHLDDRYIEDKLEWLAERKAADRADAVLQRQQEAEQNQRAEAAHKDLLVKVDTLTERGSELYEDFQEAVVDRGLKGDWPLEQATFEAAHDAVHGAQILYELSQDVKLAKEVAGKSPYQQLRWVAERDTEIAAKAKPRHKPGAGEPPQTQTRGANSRVQDNPATDDLDDFEKQWARDEKRSN